MPSRSADDGRGRARTTQDGKNLLREFREVLVMAAQYGRTVTYGSLMARFRMSRGKALVNALGSVDRQEAAAGGPGFAALVVRRDTGFPGGGFFCDSSLPLSLRRGRERSSDPKLSPREKAFVRSQQRRIWSHYGAMKRRAR